VLPRPENLDSGSLQKLVRAADGIRAAFAAAERESLAICAELEERSGRQTIIHELGVFPAGLSISRRKALRVRRAEKELARHRAGARDIERLRAAAFESARREIQSVDEHRDALVATQDAMAAPIDTIARQIAARVDSLAEQLRGLEHDLVRSAGSIAPPAGTSSSRNASGRRYPDRTLYRRLFAQVRPYWRSVAATAFLWLLATPLTLLMPVPLQVAVDNVVGKHPLPGYLSWMLPGGLAHSHAAVLALAALLMVLVILLTEVVWWGSYLVGQYAGERMTQRFRSEMFAHAQRLSLAYHDKRGTADAAYRIEWDAPAIQYLIVDGLIPFAASAATVASMLYITLRLDWQLGLIALGISPLLLLLVQSSRWRLRKQAHKIKGLESSGLGVVQEVLSMLRVVKAFAQEPREHERFVRTSSQGMHARIRQALTESVYGLGTAFVIGAGSGAVLYVGIRHVEARALTLGGLILIIGYLTRLYDPLKTMSRQVGSLQTHLASADRAFSLLDEQVELLERPAPLRLARARGEISFRDVSFAYEPGHAVLQNISFDVRQAARVGIRGSTGAGKSTLLNLLMRLYDPTSGQILLDGHDLRDYHLADLRRQFAIVLQETVLFATSIRENVAYGRSDASFESVVEAAKAANAHDFIERLPDGYDTVVSERGVSLSGGERQRISIARAFLKDAPILLLDEPTSSVDSDTEAAILEAMARLMTGRTTFMIAHRLSTLGSCDLQLELRAGSLIDVSDSAWTAVR
jgi:ATP-binding cassette subfamily B protein